MTVIPYGYLSQAVKEYALKSYQAGIEEGKKQEFTDKVWKLLMDCLPSDAENLSTLTPDQKIRLLNKFLKSYEHK
jgi:hypothetical protein